MKKIKKTISLVLMYLLLVSLVPSSVLTKVVQAATNLKTVEVSTPYYIMGASQYKNKTFLFGKDTQVSNDKVKVSVIEDGKASIVVPASQITETINFYSETKTKMNITFFDYVFSIDKTTNEYNKTTVDKFYSKFNTAINTLGLENVWALNALYANEELQWVYYLGYNDQTSSYEDILVNKNGTIKRVTRQEYSLRSDFQIDKDSNIYFYDSKSSKIIKIDTNGTEIAFDLPFAALNSWDWATLLVDDNNNIYFLDQYDYKLYILNQDADTLELLKTEDNITGIFKQVSNNQVAYTSNKDNANSIAGVIDSSLNLVDKYSLGNYDYYGLVAYDENNMLIRNYENYGIIAETTTTTAPTAPEVTFSFDGKNAGKLFGSKSTMEFSLDGGQNYSPIKSSNYKFAASQLVAINAENGILVRYKKTSKASASDATVIQINAAPAAPELSVDDTANKVIGLIDTTMEYSKNGGKTWTKYNGKTLPSLTGNITLLVRKYATATTISGEKVTLEFKKNK